MNEPTTTKKSVALVLLSYNECKNLEELIDQIDYSLFDKVIAIDPGSTDGTLEIYKEHKIPVYIQQNRGRGNAFLLAQNIVQQDCVVFFSTDGNENPADLSVMKDHLLDGYDMVVAGRYLLRGSATDNSDDHFRIRKMLGIIGGLVIKLIWGSNVIDAINGYRGFQLTSMHAMALDAPLHEIELQSTIRASKLGMRVKEFPTQELLRKFENRKESADTLTLSWRLGYYLLREIVIGKRFKEGTHRNSITA